MKNKRILSLLFLAVYLLFIFYITLYSRSFSLTHACRLELFYSYGQWLHGSAGTGKQILLNIALFVPAGYFLAEALRAWNVKRAGVLAFLIGFVITAAIEMIQYADGLGCGELDDVFNNALGTALGVAIYKLWDRLKDTGKRERYKTWVAVTFLLAGIIGCNMVTPASLRPLQMLDQLDFAVDGLSSQDNRFLLQGTCRAYNVETPVYQILLQGEKSGRIYKADTLPDGDRFEAVLPAMPEEKAEVLVKFKIYSPWHTSVYINKDRVEYVRSNVKEPDITGTDLEHIVREGVLQVYEPVYNVYVYQLDHKLYWLIGTPLDKRTTVLCYVHTNEPEKLPEKVRKYKRVNLNFRAGSKNEITRTMRCGKYRVFVRDIPTEYHVTAVRTGFYENRKFTWDRYFRVK